MFRHLSGTNRRISLVACVLGLAGTLGLIAWLCLPGTNRLGGSGEKESGQFQRHNVADKVEPPHKDAGPDVAVSAVSISRPMAAGQRKQANPYTQEELERMFEQDVADLNRIVTEYLEKQAILFDEHPEIPALKTWIHKSNESHYETNRERLDKITLFNNEHRETLSRQKDLAKLQSPEAILAVMNDPEFGPLFDDVFEVAGRKNSIGNELRDWDRQAGYKPAELDAYAVDTPAQLRAALVARVPHFQKAFLYQSSQSGLPQFLIEQTPLDAQYNEFRNTAKLYVDSFYGGEMEQLRRAFNALTSKMNSIYPWDQPFAKAWEEEFQKLALAYGDAGKK